MLNSQPSEQELLREALGPGKECPSIEELEQVRSGGITAPGELTRHIESCTYCQTELHMLQMFQATEQTPVSKEVRQVSKKLQARSAEILGRPSAVKQHLPWWKAAWTMRGFAQASLAAAVLLLVAGAVIRLHSPNSPSISQVDRTGQDVLRSGSFSVTSPVGDLQERPSEVRWEKVQGAATYRVRLLEVDRSEMWKAETAEEHIDLPSSIRSRIVPAKTLFWEISALDTSGNRVGETGLVRFRFVQNLNGRQ